MQMVTYVQLMQSDKEVLHMTKHLTNWVQQNRPDFSNKPNNQVVLNFSIQNTAAITSTLQVQFLFLQNT